MAVQERPLNIQSRDLPPDLAAKLGFKPKKRRRDAPVLLVEESFVQQPGRIVWTVPIHVVSEPNRRDFWARRHKRSAQQRESLSILLASRRESLEAMGRPSKITFIRLGKRLLDRADNLRAAFKSQTDEICLFYWVDDGEACPIAFDFDQIAVKGPVGMRIVIESSPKTSSIAEIWSEMIVSA